MKDYDKELRELQIMLDEQKRNFENLCEFKKRYDEVRKSRKFDLSTLKNSLEEQEDEEDE